jgi:hypothetical protein
MARNLEELHRRSIYHPRSRRCGEYKRGLDQRPRFGRVKARNVRGFSEKELDSWLRKAGLAEPASAAWQLSRMVSTASDGPNSEECISWLTENTDFRR